MPFDPNQPLQPLHRRTPPLASVREMLALNTVLLTAQNTPRPALVQFYTHTLGLLRIPEDQPHVLSFRHNRRRVTLSPDHPQGHLALAITQFDSLISRLQDLRFPHELLHIDGGLARVVFVRDPARNLIRLLETRPF